MNVLHTLFAAENLYWLKDTPKKDFFVYFELRAEKYEPTAKRVPLNIALVIDRSGSMHGEKLDYVKKAVEFVIENLNSTDYLSLVQYDDVVEVISNASQVSNKAELKKKVHQIQSRGSTNLSGGMLEGYNQVGIHHKSGFVNRNLLLSDGLANVGITEPEQLKMIAQKKFREQGIALSTFGVGADFNEELMTHLSEYGGANYYFIEKPDKIPEIFAKELSGLLSVVAQNAKLHISFPKQQLKCTKVFGYPADIRDNTIQVDFNDVFSEERKAVLIQFEITQAIQRNISFEASLVYDDVVKKLERITETHSIEITPTQDVELFKSKVNPSILEQIVAFVGNDMFEAAIQRADKREFEIAKQMITQVKAYLDAHFKSYPPTAELKTLYENILAYEAKLERMEYMSSEEYLVSQKMSKMASYDYKRKKP